MDRRKQEWTTVFSKNVSFWKSFFLIFLLFTFSEGLARTKGLKIHFAKSQNIIFVPATLPLNMNLFGISANQMNFISEDGKKNPFLLPEGEYSIEIPSVKPRKYIIKSDGSAPISKLLFNNAISYTKEGVVYYGRNLELEFISKDPISGIENFFLSRNGSDYKVFKPGKYTFTQNGTYKLAFFGIDRVGNREETKKVNFILDTRSPQSSIKVNGRVNSKFQYLNGGAIEIEAYDNLSGIKVIKYSFDSKNWNDYVQEIDLNEIGLGKKKIYFYSIDNLDIKEKIKSYEFHFDNIKPELALDLKGEYQKQNQVYFINNSTEIIIDANDTHPLPLKTFYQINQGSFVPLKKSFKMSAQSGENQLTIKAIDGAGNVTQEIYYFYVDRTPPKIDFNINPLPREQDEKLFATPGTQIRLKGRDGGVGMGKQFLCINNKCQQYKDKYTLTDVGTYKVYSYAFDLVGNKYISQELNIEIPSGSKAIAQTQSTETEKKWVSDQNFGSIGPKGKKFYLAITDSPSKKASENTFIVNADIPQENLKDKDGHEIHLSFGKYKLDTFIPVDKTPPETTIFFNQGKKYQEKEETFFGPGTTVSFFSTDKGGKYSSGAEKIYFSVDGRDFKEYQKQSYFKPNKERPYIIKYFSQDRVGNRESPKLSEFKIDLSSPRTQFSLEGSCFENICSADSTLTLKALDGNSGIGKLLYRFNNSAKFSSIENKELKILFKNKKEGLHHLYYQSLDNVGNLEKVKKFDFFVDKTPPSTRYKIIGQSCKSKKKLVVGKNNYLQFFASDKLSGLQKIEWRQNNGEWKNYRKGISFDQHKGPVNISYRSIDRVGNILPNQSLALIADFNRPETHVKVKGPHHKFLNYIHLKPESKIYLFATDDTSRLNQIKYRINSGAFINYTGPLHIKNRSEFNLSFYAVDCVGNREKLNSFQVSIDNRPPLLAFKVSPQRKPASAIKIKEKPFLYLTYKDFQSGVKNIYYSLNGSRKAPYKNPIPLPKKGKMTIEIWATDWVNNSNYIKKQFEVQQ